MVSVTRMRLLLPVILLTLVTHMRAGVTRTGLVVVREEDTRVKRAVGPVGVGADLNNGLGGGGQQRKYRRLEHSIMVQADIRSRSVDTWIHGGVIVEG